MIVRCSRCSNYCTLELTVDTKTGDVVAARRSVPRSSSFPAGIKGPCKNIESLIGMQAETARLIAEGRPAQ